MFSKPKEKIIHGRKYLESKFELYQLGFYDRKDILHRLKTYFKFLVVRHPFDRMVSGYKDKLTGRNMPYRRTLVKRILNMFHGGEERMELDEANGVSFDDFTKYMITEGYKMKDQHFARMEKYCAPCQIRYDYIAKLETHNIDAYNIIKTKLSGHGLETFSNIHSTTGGASMWKALPLFNNVSDATIQELKDIFDNDMHMFGYTLERDEKRMLRARCGVAGEENECC